MKTKVQILSQTLLDSIIYDTSFKNHELVLPLAWVRQSPLISCSFNPLLSGQRTDARGRPICRGRAKSKGEPQELCKQRKQRAISPCSLRSRGLNLHNLPDVHCICGIPEFIMNHHKIETVDFGSNCRFVVCCMRLTSFWFIWLY